MFFVSVKNKLFCKRNKDDEEKGKNRKLLRLGVAVSAALVLLVALWMVYASCHMPSYSYCEGVGKYSLEAENEDDREDFFEQFGYKAEEVESSQVTIPSQGDVLREYNEIQKSHGMNILPYGDRKAQFYVYELQRGEDMLFGFMTVYRDKAVAVHISDCEYPSEIRSLRE